MDILHVSASENEKSSLKWREIFLKNFVQIQGIFPRDCMFAMLIQMGYKREDISEWAKNHFWLKANYCVCLLQRMQASLATEAYLRIENWPWSCKLYSERKQKISYWNLLPKEIHASFLKCA